MKIIIVEGTDNIGKDTAISNIINEFNKTLVIHCGKPVTEDPVGEQDRLYRNMTKDILLGKYGDVDAIVFNRSFIGEYVYGTLYRKRDKEQTKIFVNSIEDLLNLYIDPEDLIYIQMISDSVQLMKDNEDNKSLSKADEDMMQKEINLFLEIYESSKIKNKHLVYVNSGDHFRPVEYITQEILSYIK